METTSGRFLGHHIFRCPEAPRQWPPAVYLRNRDKRNRLSSIPFRMGTAPQRAVFTRLVQWSRNYEYVYGMGRENCKLLMKILERPVYDLEDHGCPNYARLRVPELNATCPLDHFCTQTMALLLHRWFRNPAIRWSDPGEEVFMHEPEEDWDEEAAIE